MRQLTKENPSLNVPNFSKLPMRQLTILLIPIVAKAFSKLPMRQLTWLRQTREEFYFSKLPMRQLTVGFCANILMLPKLASVYSYLTKILCACQNP